MGSRSFPVGRRLLLQLAGAGAVFPPVLGSLTIANRSTEGAAGQGSAAEVADTYHRLLLRHTRWSETQWDESRGIYTDKDFGFAVVLGHAVLLTHGTFDEDLAGIDRQTLKDRTLATLCHFASSNRLTGGTQWGRTLFFDTTFQSYFVLAAHLLWDELDPDTRSAIDTITREQAAYTHSLGTGDDPDSGDWTTNGLLGGYIEDTKLEEMGVYAQSLAPALAWAPDDPRHSDWAGDYGAWSRNEGGLPPADLANPTPVDGVPVSKNTAHNSYDTFLVENHGSFGPHYQAEMWRTSGRNAIHFLAAGRPLPEVLNKQPNAEPLWHTLLGVMSDAGEPLQPMVDDREHLYGRDVIPLAFLATVGGDRAAARAELELAARLEAYQAYPPEHRLTKFSGEPKYEPEARAELAISYLLHVWPNAGPEVPAFSRAELFAYAAGVTDFGTGPGLVSHQSPAAWAGVVTKPGFVKFAWQPGHDDWLFRVGGGTAMFLPSTTAELVSRTVRVHTTVRDGFDGSATLLRTSDGFAGYTTLPTGAVVYACDGTATGRSRLEVHNLTMPGVPGLNGRRTYRFAEGTATVEAADAAAAGAVGSAGAHASVAAGRVDELSFDRVTVRQIRMLGVRPDPEYGYSLYAVEARDGADAPDLVRGCVATASSHEPGMEPGLATDGDGETRWAVARSDRQRPDSWWAVDLGAPHALDRVTLRWEAAAGRHYLVQGSSDGERWTDLVAGPAPALRSHGGWLDVDGRAGLVVRESSGPIAVYGDLIVLAEDGREPLLVEGHCDASADQLRAIAAGATPVAADQRVRAALTDQHLSLFNLSAEPVRTRVEVPQQGPSRQVFEGEQTVTRHGVRYAARLDAAAARLFAPRFTLTALSGHALPSGLRVRVVDGATLRLDGPGCRVRIEAQNRSTVATVRPGRTTRVTVPGAQPYPHRDLALGRTTFPITPLPSGMSRPDAAVDGDPDTGWLPGGDGRMVVDLGAERSVRRVEVRWTTPAAPDTDVEFSADGLSYQRVGSLRGTGRVRRLEHTGSPRYVAVRVRGTPRPRAAVERLSVR